MRIVKKILLYSPVLVACLLMLPRLVSPDFGLFDDGRTLVLSQGINQGVWDMSWDSAAGRFRPVYWLYYAVVYRFSGTHPVGFFLANTFILAATVAILIALARVLGLNRLQAWSAGVIFALSGPVIENFYTLSKAEPLQLLAISLGLLFAVHFAHDNMRWRRILLLMGCFVSFLLAYLVKETTLVVIPIGAACGVLAWVRSLRTNGTTGRQTRIAVFGSSTLAGVVFFIARKLVVPVSLTGGSYSDQYSFTVQRIIASTVRWSGWLIRDFAFLVPLVLSALILWFALRQKKTTVSNPSPQAGFQDAPLLLDAFIWMAAWIVVYLPWVFMQEYYALPFSFGAALAAGLAIGWLVDQLQRRQVAWRVFSGAILGLATLLWLVTLPTNLSNARIQLAVDDANTRLLTGLADHAAQGSTVLVNIQVANEYVEQMALYYLPKVYSRPDLVVVPYQSQPLGDGSEYHRPDVILAMPQVEHQPLLSVRMGLYEPTQKDWNADLLARLTPDWVMGTLIQNQFQLLIVDLPRLFCPLIRTRLFCSVPSPLLDQRLFSYGWALYQIQP